MRQNSKSRLIVLSVTLILMSALFFLGGPDYHSPRSFKAIWNLGHIIYFAVLPLLLFPLANFNQLKPLVQIALIVGVTLILGALIECLQYGLNRVPDMGDLFRNLIGAGIAVCFLLPLKRSLPKNRVFQTMLVLLVVVQIYPVAVALIDEHHASRDFPILSNFQSPFQRHRWVGGANITIENGVGHPGNRALRADLTTQQYSGAALTYFPGDWRDNQWFQFRIYNPSAETIALTCRIHDKKHTQGVQKYEDRFNRRFSLVQGWNTITISLTDIRSAPQDRQMDMSRIYGIGIFATQLPRPRTIYIDDLKLAN